MWTEIALKWDCNLGIYFVGRFE